MTESTDLRSMGQGTRNITDEQERCLKAIIGKGCTHDGIHCDGLRESGVDGRDTQFSLQNTAVVVVVMSLY